MSRALLFVPSGIAARAVSRPAWQSFVRLGVLPHCSLRAVLFVILAVCGRAVDAATVIYEYNNTGTAAYEFATIPGPITGDLGESAAFFANVDGAKHGLSDDLTDSSSLTNGDGSSDGSHTTSPLFFFANDEDPARLLMSWDSPQPIQEVRTFSWHSHTGTARAAQRYTLYGTNAAIDGDNWTYNSSDWTLLATVDSAADRGGWSGHPFQTAVSIQGTGPGALGTYQHLLWDTTASNAPQTPPTAEQHTIWREFDVLVNSGGLISNGNFETASGDPLTFTGWTYNGTAAIVQTDSVISGSRSAEIVRGGGRYLQQQATEAMATFSFEMDFAVFPVTGEQRSMNLLLKEGTSGANRAMNFRVKGGGQLQVHDGSTWQAIGSLTANVTTDTNALLEWNGEEPVANHLKIVGYLSDPNNRYYNVTLNGSSVNDLQWFSQGLSPATISYIQLNGASSASNWLVDNVSFTIPEPSSAAMLGVVLLLAAAPRRRRRDAGRK